MEVEVYCLTVPYFKPEKLPLNTFFQNKQENQQRKNPKFRETGSLILRQSE